MMLRKQWPVSSNYGGLFPLLPGNRRKRGARIQLRYPVLVVAHR